MWPCAETIERVRVACQLNHYSIKLISLPASLNFPIVTRYPYYSLFTSFVIYGSALSIRSLFINQSDTRAGILQLTSGVWAIWLLLYTRIKSYFTVSWHGSFFARRILGITNRPSRISNNSDARKRTANVEKINWISHKPYSCWVLIKIINTAIVCVT